MHHAEVTHDAALPLTWVPTKGNNIPPNAVPLRGGRGRQLFVARGYVGDEMRIGTASHSSTEGAQLQGRDLSYLVFEYEVLTCASILRFQLESPRPPTSVEVRGPPDRKTGGEMHEGDIIQRRQEVQFKHFAQSKCFTLIDDTSSMQSSWSQTRDALTGVIDVLSSDDGWDGLDVRFLHHAETYPCIKTREEFVYAFDSVTHTGDEEMTEKVFQVFQECLPLIQETSTARRVVLLIITDYMASDPEELFNAIVRFCQILDEERIPQHMFTIYILQMGNDRGAVQPLHDFRDRLIQRVPDRLILNVVSFHRGRGLLNSKHIIDLLLASTYIPPEEDPGIRERLPATVIETQYQALETIREMGRP